VLVSLLAIIDGSPKSCSSVLFVDLGAVVVDIGFVAWFYVARKCVWQSPDWCSWLCVLIILIVKILADFLFALGFGFDCLTKSDQFTNQSSKLMLPVGFYSSLAVPFYEILVMSVMAYIQVCSKRQQAIVLQDSFVVL
jgi:hypothetical protein